ncbi:MAG: TonB-dependent receptor [Opitutaceae bacterium]|nr:TonB-dependent receptor [Opitutaceae bacterium]
MKIPCQSRSRPPGARFLGAFAAAGLALPASAQTAPPPTAPAVGNKGDVTVMSEFKIYDKKPVPFTDANMDIPRGINDVQAYYVIGREELENTGKNELDEILRDSLTQNTVVETNAQIDPSALSNQLGSTSSINLRGLGASQTLILINGMRTSNFANRGATFQPDVNGIPLAAVDRVEVLPGSASAIYGGTAVGGVVNVILKRNYTGGQVSASYQNTLDTDAPIRTLSAIYGFSLGRRTHVTVSGSISDGKPLRMKDRPFLERNFKRAVANSPGTFYSTTTTFNSGATPNIVLNNAAVNGFANAQTATLTLKSTGQPLGSRITHVPYGTSSSTPAATLAAGLLTNAGRYNLDFAPSVWRGYESTLAHVSRKEALMARVDHQLNAKLSFFADFSFNRSETLDANWVPLGNGNYQFAVPGNAPTNPFRENVFVSLPISLDQATHNDVANQVSGGVVGALLKLPGDWRLAADANYSVTAQKVSYGLMNMANNTTFGGNAPLLWTGAINPFVDTIANPTAVTRYYGEWTGYNQDTMLNYNVRASGPLFSLRAGRPVLTVGTEVYTERLPQAYVGGTFPPIPPATANATNQHSYFIGQRISTYAGHAELSVPVVSGANEKPFVRGLEFQVAARTEYFHVYTNPDGRVNVFPDSPPFPRITRSASESRQDIAKLHATKPTFGAKYEPFRGVTVRASYATAFLPPTFAQLTQRINTGGLAAATPTAVFFDPVTNSSYTSLSVAGNNPGLGPETSKNWSYGIILEPQGALKDLRLNLEYWRIDKQGLIRNVNNVQQLANMGDRAPAGSVQRNATTKVIELFTFANYNVGDGMTDGWDASLDYRKATRIGLFAFRGRTTITDHLKLPPAIGFPAIEYRDFPNSGGVNRSRVTATVSWSSGRNWRASWTTIYTGGYKQAGAPGDPIYLGVANPTLVTTSTGPQGGNSVASQTYHNLNVTYNFGARHERSYFRGLSVQLTLNNVFDTEPPFDAGNNRAPFFYSRYGNVRLRDYVLRVKKDF